MRFRPRLRVNPKAVVFYADLAFWIAIATLLFGMPALLIGALVIGVLFIVIETA